MREVTIGYAKDHLSALIQSLVDGTETEIVIMNRRTPVARLLPIADQPPRERTFGICKEAPGLLDDKLFDELDAEIANDFGAWV